MNESYKKLVEETSSESEDNLWLITMTDLMSLLLVCFLMFFVISKRHEKAAEQAKQQPSAAKSQTIDKETTATETSTPANTPVSTPEISEMAAAELAKSVPETPAAAASERRIIDKETTATETGTPEISELAAAIAESDMKTAASDQAPALDAFIRAQKLENDVTVTSVNKDIVITMREKVSFVPGSAVILKNTTPVLDKVAELIKRHPSYVVEIDGHTDNLPIHSPLYPSNWELSSARAMSVLQYFIKVKDVDPAGFTVKGNGDSRPIVPNDSPQHRSQNRRVEIRIKEKSL